MITIGSRPILWHIMKLYSFYGINEFIICCGYKGYLIKEYFANYFLHMSDVTFDIAHNTMEVHQKKAEPWKVTLIDTGEETMTGGRLKMITDYVSHEKFFCMTYGDGLANINISKLINFHEKKGLQATVTATIPPGRFGALDIDNDLVVGFKEKPKGDGMMINGGFFVLSPKVLELIDNDKTVWEQKPLETLCKNRELAVFKHKDFWQPMDTLRDKNLLEDLWLNGRAPWKLWD
jgi:glucose-1-phosphate cytidylyltransferase